MSRAAWGFAAALALAAPVALAAQDAAAGKPVYDQWCAGCHGVDGKGAGPGAPTMMPRPRDFTRAQYQIRVTGSGELPTDADILHIINVGMPNTAMPGWEELLSDAQRNDLVAYVKSLSRFFEGAPAPTPVEFTADPGGGDERIAQGKAAYEKLECAKCHGTNGRADGQSATTIKDDLGNPIYPANLTQNWLFNGGGEPEDIYRRLRTGLDGTPMPTFADALAAGVVSDEDLWAVAHYVRSLSPAEPPATREVITASVVDQGALPTTTDDAKWSEVDKFYIPLVGQIVQKPRWFQPRVKNVWVQALHDSTDVALLVSWSDPSSSPDAAWAPFAQRVVDFMGPKDEGSTWAPGTADQLVVQFPQALSTGMDRPYFLQGDARRAAYMWSWRSDTQKTVEMVAKGFGTGVEQPAEQQQVTSTASWANGEWKVLFRRPITTPDSTADLQMPKATVIPVAFQAWDGDNGEAGFQAGVSTWYFLALEETTPATVYVAPVVAFLLTAVFGVMLVSRAQKKEKAGQ